ncbi:Androgen-dependent TFPI-regulating protein [Eumeta japonica]|uniref:Androgen-dependent TFPI-regulating protein n=1 Tax=Eumeta variegata TaxID=151549 RepID=A0A4C1WT04_EUMVA|nr:Androgen-dependent TFPI-regulating protein [Eumeta japonica]
MQFLHVVLRVSPHTARGPTRTWPGVASIFWPLYLWDRELIYPEVWDTVVPSWINHGMHGLTVLVAVFELMLEPRKPPDSRQAQLILHWFFSIAYVAM